MGIRSAAVAVRARVKARRTSLLVGMAAMVSTVLFAGILWAQPLLAAVEFNYFNVIASPAGVVLEWSTASEANISGFDVLCKRSDEADTQFHSIGYVPAKGTLATGALYTFPVTALEPGVPYCFRLVELTNDGTPGEVQDRCGYGISITPTPQLIGVQPNLVPGATPAVTPTPGGIPPFDPFVATATAQALQFPPNIDPFAATATAQALMGYPSPTTTSLQTETPTSYPSPQTNTGGSAVASVPEPTATMMPPALAAAPTPGSDSALALAPDAPQVRTDGVAAAPTPAFIIATATPTQEAVVFGPGMTPLPTVTPTAGMTQLVNLIEPTSQNLMVMMLCMTFTGATGLGVLGLITSVMFMRSRSSQREFYDRHSSRRRY